MEKINLTCDLCDTVHSVDRTNEIPKDVISIVVNWCPVCSDRAIDLYNEEYIYQYPEESKNVVTIIDPDQLTIFDCGA